MSFDLYIAWEIIKEATPKVLKILLSIGKGIWRSTLSILYLIVYSYLLFALIGYYGYEQMLVDVGFLEIIKMLSDNWKIFWWIFFVSNVWDDLKWRND